MVIDSTDKVMCNKITRYREALTKFTSFYSDDIFYLIIVKIHSFIQFYLSWNQNIEHEKTTDPSGVIQIAVRKEESDYYCIKIKLMYYCEPTQFTKNRNQSKDCY